ncbi:hypothetical protein GCM10012320_34940 [Sinomonas cellulolyticus]|nr:MULTISPECIES: site-specific integrase [Sinomonas]GHG60372.1 hypothetical protein GCM10012320_34940 [Sinomonas sp. KCTC 49339]
MGADGNPQRKVEYAATKALGEAKRRELATKARAGLIKAGRSPVLGDWLEEWISEALESKMRERTKRDYRSYIRTRIHGRPIAKKRLDKTRPSDLAAVYAEMRAAGRSETTVAQMHRILSRGLKVAVQMDEAAVNPASCLEAPQPAPFAPTVLSVDEARRLIDAAEKLDDGARWLLNLALGPRQGERLAITWDLIDLKTGKLPMDRTLTWAPWEHGCGRRCAAGLGAPRTPVPGAEGRRSVRDQAEVPRRDPRPDPAQAAAQRTPPPQEAHQGQVRAEEGENWTGFTSADGLDLDDLVFTDRRGRPLNPRTDWEHWKKFLAANHVPAVASATAATPPPPCSSSWASTSASSWTSWAGPRPPWSSATSTSSTNSRPKPGPASVPRSRARRTEARERIGPQYRRLPTPASALGSK